MLAARPHAATGTFNISNGEPLTVHDLLTRTFGALNREGALRPRPLSPAHPRRCREQGRVLHRVAASRACSAIRSRLADSQTLDITAARNHLGYEPRVSIDEGLTRYAAWLRGEAHPLAAIASAAAATPAYGGTA